VSPSIVSGPSSQNHFWQAVYHWVGKQFITTENYHKDGRRPGKERRQSLTSKCSQEYLLIERNVACSVCRCVHMCVYTMCVK